MLTARRSFCMPSYTFAWVTARFLQILLPESYANMPFRRETLVRKLIRQIDSKNDPEKRKKLAEQLAQVLKIERHLPGALKRR